MVDRIGFNQPPSGSDNNPPPRRVQFGLQAEMEDEFVRVERREKVEQVAARSQMEIPWFDYLYYAFDEDNAKEFAKTKYGPREADAEILGKEFLNLLVTPEAIDPGDLPDEPSRLNYADYGMPETLIRERLMEKGLPVYFYEDLLRIAHRDGLVYRMVELQGDNGRTYYGVPKNVREALNLEASEKPKAAEAAPLDTGKGEREAFVSDLLSFADDVEHTGNREWLEYGAELLQSARKAELISFEQIPESYRAVDVDQAFVPRLEDALVTFLESTFGSSLFDGAERLAEQAVNAGLMNEGELSAALADIREFN